MHICWGYLYLSTRREAGGEGVNSDSAKSRHSDSTVEHLECSEGVLEESFSRIHSGSVAKRDCPAATKRSPIYSLISLTVLEEYMLTYAPAHGVDMYV